MAGAPTPEIPPTAAVRSLSKAAGNGTVRLDPAGADQFLKELTAVRDEVELLSNDARRMSERVPKFGANSTGQAMSQKFVDRANDFAEVLLQYHQVLTDLDGGARQAVANWIRADQDHAAGFSAAGPR